MDLQCPGQGGDSSHEDTDIIKCSRTAFNSGFRTDRIVTKSRII